MAIVTAAAKPRASLVSERFDGIQTRRLEGGIHAEENADRRRVAEADRERPPWERDGEAGEQMDGPADAGVEADADPAAERGEKRRLHEKLKQDLGAAG